MTRTGLGGIMGADFHMSLYACKFGSILGGSGLKLSTRSGLNKVQITPEGKLLHELCLDVHLRILKSTGFPAARHPVADPSGRGCVGDVWKIRGEIRREIRGKSGSRSEKFL